MSKAKSNAKKRKDASSISVQKMAVLATIISAVVGGLSGYLGSHLQTKMLKSIKMDDIARSMAEADLAQMKQLGTSSFYSPIAHYVVNRRILEDFDVSKPISIEELREETENAMNVCMENRRMVTQLYIARLAHQQQQKTVQSVRDDVEKYYNHIDSLPDTPEFNKYKIMLRTFAKGEMARLNTLEGMSDGQGLNRSRELFLEALLREPNRVDDLLFEGE